MGIAMPTARTQDDVLSFQASSEPRFKHMSDYVCSWWTALFHFKARESCDMIHFPDQDPIRDPIRIIPFPDSSMCTQGAYIWDVLYR